MNARLFLSTFLLVLSTQVASLHAVCFRRCSGSSIVFVSAFFFFLLRNADRWAEIALLSAVPFFFRWFLVPVSTFICLLSTFFFEKKKMASHNSRLFFEMFAFLEDYSIQLRSGEKGLFNWFAVICVPCGFTSLSIFTRRLFYWSIFFLLIELYLFFSLFFPSLFALTACKLQSSLCILQKKRRRREKKKTAIKETGNKQTNKQKGKQHYDLQIRSQGGGVKSQSKKKKKERRLLLLLQRLRANIIANKTAFKAKNRCSMTASLLWRKINK